MEGAKKYNNGFIEILARFERKKTILWELFGVGLTYLYSSQEDQSWLDLRIRKEFVPTRCDVGYMNWYYTQLGDEDERVASYEPEKGTNAIILAVQRKPKIFNEFPGFVDLINGCADLKNAHAYLGFEKRFDGNIAVCPIHVELEDDVLSLHIMCHFAIEVTREDIQKVTTEIGTKYMCNCMCYRSQLPE